MKSSGVAHPGPPAGPCREQLKGHRRRPRDHEGPPAGRCEPRRHPRKCPSHGDAEDSKFSLLALPLTTRHLWRYASCSASTVSGAQERSTYSLGDAIHHAQSLVLILEKQRVRRTMMSEGAWQICLHHDHDGLPIRDQALGELRTLSDRGRSPILRHREFGAVPLQSSSETSNRLCHGVLRGSTRPVNGPETAFSVPNRQGPAEAVRRGSHSGPPPPQACGGRW